MVFSPCFSFDCFYFLLFTAFYLFVNGLRKLRLAESKVRIIASMLITLKLPGNIIWAIETILIVRAVASQGTARLAVS